MNQRKYPPSKLSASASVCTLPPLGRALVVGLCGILLIGCGERADPVAEAARRERIQRANEQFAHFVGLAERYTDRNDLENAERSLASADALTDATERQSADAVRAKIAAKRRGSDTRMANAAVARAVESAEKLFATGRVDEAAALLTQATSDASATEVQAAQQLLAKVKEAQAKAALGQALEAVEQRRFADAHRLLQFHFTHPQADRSYDNQRLLDALEVAVMDDKAQQAVANMPDVQVSELAGGGVPTQFDTGKEHLNDAVRTTLARHAAAEQRKREAARLAQLEAERKREAQRMAEAENTKSRQVDKLRQAIARRLGSNGASVSIHDYQGGPRKRVSVSWDISENLTKGLTRLGAQSEVVDILRAVAESDIDYAEINVVGSFPLVDTFGNSSKTQVLKATYRDSTVKRINWVNFLTENVYTIADDIDLHPAFRE